VPDSIDHRSGQASAPRAQRLSATVRTLGVVSLLNDTAGDMIHPLLPALVMAVGRGPEVLGVIEGFADAAASLVQILSGYLADRVRRLKAITFAGYAIAIVLRPLLALASSWPEILVIRVGDRTGKGVRSAPRDAMLAGASAREVRGRAYGFHRAMDNGGAIVGPAVAYLMLTHGLSMRTVFACTAFPGALALLLLAFGVSDLRLPRAERTIELGLPVSPTYRRFLLSIFVFTLGSSSDAFLIWRAQEVGVGVAYVPVLWLTLALVTSATSLWGGAMSDSVGRRKMILAGWIIYAAVYVCFALANAAWQFWVLFPIYGAFYGLTESPERALVVDLVPEHWRGRALGAYHAAVGFAALPASLIFGIVYQIAGAEVAFTMGAALAVIAILIMPRGRLAAAR
jgi:MFS family permease